MHLVGEISSTREDLHGDVVQLDELKQMAARLEGRCILLGYRHDLRHPPIGRMVSTRLMEQEGGEHILQGTFEIWDEVDKISAPPENGRKIDVELHDYCEPTIQYNPLSLNQEDQDILIGITKLGFQLKDDRIEKALDSIVTSIVIYGSICLVGKAVGGFIDGFFNQLGGEASKEFIKRLRDLFSTKPSYERLVILRCPIIHKEIKCELNIILDKSMDLEQLLDFSLRHMEELVGTAIASEPRTKIIVIGCTNGEFRTLYSVRDDGFPSELEPVTEEELSHGGLSVEGSAKRTSLKK